MGGKVGGGGERQRKMKERWEVRGWANERRERAENRRNERKKDHVRMCDMRKRGKEREREKAGSNIRFKLSNWISAPEALGSGSKFAKRARNANRDGEDRYWAEQIGPFERSLDFQSRLQTCANITVRYMSGVPLFANYLYKSTITSNRIF